jgi:Ca2+-binding RTX toxin-like protein
MRVALGVVIDLSVLTPGGGRRFASGLLDLGRGVLRVRMPSGTRWVAPVESVRRVRLPYGKWVVLGSAADEQITGVASVVVRAGGGDDTLFGSDEDDVLLGGPGNGRGGDDRCRAERTLRCER